jgi:hypothetical protein
MKSHWVTHQGKRVFIADFSNCGSDAALISAECAAIKAELSKELPASVRSVTNAQGTFSNPEVIKALSELLPYSNKYVRRRAAVGNIFWIYFRILPGVSLLRPVTRSLRRWIGLFRTERFFGKDYEISLDGF